MPRVKEPLSDKTVRALQCAVSGETGKKYNALHAVGGVPGLMLQVTPSGAKSWIYRYVIGERRRSMGLGSYPEITLSEARETAREYRAMIRENIDPIEHKRSEKLDLIRSQRKNLTFKQVANECYKVKAQEFHNAKHAKQWWTSLERVAFPAIGSIPINDINTADVVRMLEPIWTVTPDAADKVRQRTRAVIEYALTGDTPLRENPVNPADMKHLKTRLPAIKKVKRKAGKGDRHHPALPYAEVPRLMQDLATRKSISAKALQFAILTAARSGEVREATWNEIDFKAKTWRLSAERMKADRPHTVPLSDAVLELLRDLPRDTPENRIFPSVRGKTMSDMALSKMLKDAHHADLKRKGMGYVDPQQDSRIATPHGTARSSFKEWCRKSTRYPDEWSEIALAHVNSNETHAAYARDELLSERRQLMQEWANYCRNGKQASASVAAIGEARA